MDLSETDRRTVLGRLSSLGQFDADDISRLASLAWTMSHVPAGGRMRLADAVSILGSGWAARYRVLASGRRQLTNLLLPGDLCSYEFLLGPMAHADLVALTPVSVWKLPLAEFVRITEERPNVLKGILGALAGDSAISQELLVSLGSRPALSRAAHLICELYCRLAQSGLVHDGRVPFPLTQSEIGDYLALSSVHVNRTMQALRKKNLISTDGGYLRIVDQQELAQIAGFDPSYLGGSNRSGPARRASAIRPPHASDGRYDPPGEGVRAWLS